MADNLRFFGGAARCMEGKSAGEYLEGYTSLRPPRAGRRDRPDRALELPADDGRVEVRPGAGHRQHGRPQAGRDHAAEHPALRRAGRRAPPQGRAQRAHRPRRDRRGARRAPRRRHGLAHPLGRVGQARRPRSRRRPSSACTSSGGKAPVVVFDDVDMETAATIAGTGYYNAGQDCTAATRVLAGKKVTTTSSSGLAEQAKGLVLGDTLSADTTLAPLQQRRPARAGSRGSSSASRPRRGRHRRRRARPARLLPRAGRGPGPAPGRRDDPARDLRAGHHRPARLR